MNTQSHALMGAVLFGRGLSRRAWAGVAGGLAPDVAMIAIVAGLKISGIADRVIFGELYWQSWWQITNGIAHSFLLWGGLLILALMLRPKEQSFWQSQDRWTLVSIFASSALLHSVVDFLCHREDAHMSFWPLTNWKFVSPVSYYDSNHFGSEFGMFEAGLGLAMGVILFRQFKHWAVRGLLALSMAAYIAVPAYFILT
jgi:LexA-binding, inner membrane-associated putative hydrolase